MTICVAEGREKAPVREHACHMALSMNGQSGQMRNLRPSRMELCREAVVGRRGKMDRNPLGFVEKSCWMTKKRFT